VVILKVVINGFGRIGRVILKIALERKINVVAINDIHGPDDAAYLLKYDSIYRTFKGRITHGKDFIKVNGHKIKVLSEMDPSKLPWKELKIDTVVESTGIFIDRKGAGKHLDAGAKKVVITAPAKDHDVTIVPGVNTNDLKKKHKLISVASCTTNCLAPVVKVLEDSFGIKNALMTTVHAYTNDQVMHDSFHKKTARGRAAAMNMIPTSTGASKAVTEVLPKLNGKLEGMAVRVPIGVGSLVDLTANLKKPFSVEKVNNAFKKASEGKLKGILEYNEDCIVSSDVIGNSNSSIFSAVYTQQNGKSVKIFAWYDNEYGYSSRVVDVLKMLK
jgi:glyceraldehyde 3-phosphate dehydrogenase